MLIFLSNFSSLTYRPAPWFFSGMPLPHKMTPKAGHQKQFTSKPGPVRCGVPPTGPTEPEWRLQGTITCPIQLYVSLRSFWASLLSTFFPHVSKLWQSCSVCPLIQHFLTSCNISVGWVICLSDHTIHFPRTELDISCYPRLCSAQHQSA